jgi:uncharacterized membrane protein YqjE
MRLLDSARSLLSDVLSLAQTRLELLGTELQEELARLFLALLCAVSVLLLGALAALFAGLALLLAVGEPARVVTAGALAFAFVTLAAVAGWLLRGAIAARRRAFDASLTELGRDLAALKP